MKFRLHTTQFMGLARWLRSLSTRHGTASAGSGPHRRKPPAAFCTHIATTMQWRISGDR